MYEPEYDDSFETSDHNDVFDNEFIDEAEYYYDEMDDELYYEDHFPSSVMMDDDPLERYSEDYEHYPLGYDSVIYPDELFEPDKNKGFWTRRRVVIVILVILMIGALLYPTAYNIYVTANQPDVPFHRGPTPTALPSV